MVSTVCLHHNDADGRASGAIVRYALGDDVLFYEMDYDGSVVPWNVIETARRVVVVDFSLPKADMLRAAEGRDFIWIDHHKSALDEMADVAGHWQGIQDLNEAACVLTWRYFFPQKPVPRAITLIGDRDIWRWAEPETGAFTEGLFHRDTHIENWELWQALLEDDQTLLQEIITEGARLREIRLKQIENQVGLYGFEVEFEGFRTLAVNLRGNGDIGQRIRDLGYEVGYCYIDRLENGRLTTAVTLFSAQTDVSMIARRFGGGGHPGAAGFSFPRGATPFPPEARVIWPDSN